MTESAKSDHLSSDFFYTLDGIMDIWRAPWTTNRNQQILFPCQCGKRLGERIFISIVIAHAGQEWWFMQGSGIQLIDINKIGKDMTCLLYTSDAADE